jgi:hypothetical protein
VYGLGRQLVNAICCLEFNVKADGIAGQGSGWSPYSSMTSWAGI